jgi:hypothetical protein
MCVKFKLNRYRFAVVIAISFGGPLFSGQKKLKRKMVLRQIVYRLNYLQ